jgi:secreted PhoX family phosphatase
MRTTSRRLIPVLAALAGVVATVQIAPAEADSRTQRNANTAQASEQKQEGDNNETKNADGLQNESREDSVSDVDVSRSNDSEDRRDSLPRGLAKSSALDLTAEQIAASPRSIATVTKGLKARVVSATKTSASVDMMALWPNDTDPKWLIACNEADPAGSGVERINIATGAVESIVNNGGATGMRSCDGVRRTPWGTVLVSEEAGGGAQGGRVYEIINPLDITGVTLTRATGTFTGGTNPQNIVPRPALGRLSFEGFAVYENGVTYYGDESRPGAGTIGGAYYKFVPTTLRVKGAPAITNLNDSPFADGSIFGMQLAGQGQAYGKGKWIAVPAAPDADLRAQATALKLTGYYRPEDGDIDRKAEANGQVRFCYANTGNEAADYFGEVICITDGSIDGAALQTSVPRVNLFVNGTKNLAMPDNVANQPGTGNWVIHEDADTTYQGSGLGNHNNDLWMCAEDGADDDELADGCARIATLNDLDAERTGGIFDASGKRFFVSVQHPKTNHAVVMEITFKD